MRLRPVNLLTLFSLSSAISLTVILSLTYVGIRSIYHGYVIDVAKRQSVSISRALYTQERSLFTSGEGADAPSLSISERDFEALDQRMRDYLAPFHITKIKVFDRRGSVVYSTDPAAAGTIEYENANLQRALRGEVVAELEDETQITGIDGEMRLSIEVVETYLPVTNDGGQIIGAFDVYLDMTPHRQMEAETIRSSVLVVAAILLVTSFVQFLILRRGTAQLAEYQAKLKMMASTDALTGLSNRRFVLDRGKQEFDRAKRMAFTGNGADSVGCIMIDVDWFKEINDACGHAGGDKILGDLAARLQPLVRPYDILGRYGGEEFIVLAPHSGLKQTRVIAERIWQAIRETPFVYEGQELTITASLGISCIRRDDRHIEHTIDRADDNLYEAKQLGRDCIAR